MSNKAFDLMFEGVDVFISLRGYYVGAPEIINSFTVEDDFTLVKGFVKCPSHSLSKRLYLLIQTMSCDEMHIVCENVSIELNDEL